MWRVLQKKVRMLAQTLDGTNNQLSAAQHSWQPAVQGENLEAGEMASKRLGQCDQVNAQEAKEDVDAREEEVGADEALSLLAVRSRRERDAKLECKRDAFRQLFQPRATNVSGAMHELRAQRSALSDGGGHGSVASPTAAGEGSIGHGTAECVAVGAAPLAWFAVSGLTGRIHAFGDGSEPLPNGLGASAPLLAIIDESEHLAEPLATPHMLSAARRWVTEWQVCYRAGA